MNNKTDVGKNFNILLFNIDDCIPKYTPIIKAIKFDFKSQIVSFFKDVFTKSKYDFYLYYNHDNDDNDNKFTKRKVKLYDVRYGN